jgi:hypothetical protein
MLRLIPILSLLVVLALFLAEFDGVIVAGGR